MDFESRFEDALKAYETGQYNKALSGFEELSRLQPYASEIQLNLGNVHFKQNNLHLAESCFKKAIELDPMEGNAYLNLGNLYFRQEKLEEAVAQWEIFKKLQKNHANVWLNLGIAYDKLGDPQAAMENYSVFLGLQPTSQEANRLKYRFDAAKKLFSNHVTVAEELLGKGDQKQARDILQKALAAYPGNARLYKTYASLLYHDQDFEEALVFYEKAYALKPDDPAVLINLGVLYEKRSQPIGALWAYYQAKAIAGPEQAKVAQRFEKLLTASRGALLDGLPRAQALLQQGRYKQAERLLEQLMLLSAYLGDQRKDAFEMFERVQELQDPALRAARMYWSKGQDAEAGGQFDQALTFYNKLLHLKPVGEQADQVKARIAHIKTVMAAVVNSLLGQPNRPSS